MPQSNFNRLSFHDTRLSFGEHFSTVSRVNLQDMNIGCDRLTIDDNWKTLTINTQNPSMTLVAVKLLQDIKVKI